jgi:hypothetical protein
MSNTIINSCDPITSMDDAKSTIVSPLIPIKGLRHDENGNLTSDAIQTILDGMKSLGVDPTGESAQIAILKEAKQVLCKINAQYEYLVKAFTTSDESITDKDTLALLSEKNQSMKDIISVSRHIMELPVEPKMDEESMIEGFLIGTPTSKNKAMKEAFDDMNSKIDTRSADLQNGTGVSASEFRKRTFEVSEQENRSVNNYLSLYGFLNVVAVGLLFYIVST